MDFGVLNSYIDPAADRYKALEETEQDEYKSTLIKFVLTYSFVSGIMKLNDADMSKFHAFAQCLLKKLLKDGDGGSVLFDNEIILRYYRVQKIFEGSTSLDASERFQTNITLESQKAKRKNLRYQNLLKN